MWPCFDADLARAQNFDGLVLEHNFVLNTQISPFIIGLANELHELNKKIILVIPVSFPHPAPYRAS